MSSNPSTPRRLRALAAAIAGAGLLGTTLTGLPATAAPSSDADGQSVNVAPAETAQSTYKDGRYFVILKEDPTVTYSGGTNGLAPTAVAEGGQFDQNAPAVKKYDQHLTTTQKAVASDEGVKVQKHYTKAINGFLAELTTEQALALAKDPRVLAVSEDTELHPDYSSTEFLGLPGANGTWNRTYGGVDQAGKGVVVGVIDSGTHPDNPFLAGEQVQPLAAGASPRVGEPYRTRDGRTAMLKADGTTYYGQCQTGPEFTAEDCTDKLLGAYYYADAFLQYVPADKRDPNERISPLGVFSHGTHTATTAVGNAGVEQIMNGNVSYGEGSGVAPEAKLSSYKICWEDTDPDTGGCYTNASVSAIEQAIVDNVDVINYSISGNNTSVVDPVALAFKSAAEAGIFVSASAGNSGPTANTVNHSSPWLTTVAAETFSNELTGTVEFADGTKFRGVSSMTGTAGPADVVLSTEVGAAGKAAEDVRLCQIGALDPAKATGKIVVCDRGVNARVDKSKAVAEAGGIGMILVNVTAGSEDADLHSVPTVHINGTAVKDKVAASDVQATLVSGDTTGLPQNPLPQIAGFSSRGPSNAVESNLLKPDIAAPGVNVLAGVSPLDPDYRGDSFGLMSGTSMAAPNLAGMAALVSAKHPDWSPMAIKSAMMTTTQDVKTADGKSNADNFATGAGSADPAAMVSPGLVYESDARQWDALLMGEISGSDVNLASLAISDVVGSKTVKRTVTATQAGTWKFASSVPGYTMTASPSTLSLSKGQSAEVTLTVTRTTAKANEWTHGTFGWERPAGQSVLSPVTLRAQDVVAPTDVVGEGASGSETVTLHSGVTGQLNPTVNGLAKAESASTTKVPGGVNLVEDASNHVQEITVPAGVKALTVSVAAQRDSDDWDLRLWLPNGSFNQTGATEESSESITILDPAPGKYTILVQLFGTADNGQATARVENVMLAGDAGNLTIDPNPVPVTTGQDKDVTLAWSGLTPGVWKGLVTWTEGIATNVTVTVPEGEPEPEVCDLPDFTDNQNQSTYFYQGVRWAQCEGISNGYSNGSFGVNRSISRGESVAFLYRYLDPTFTAPATSPFKDVAVGSTHFEPITWAAAAKVTSGYTDKTFRPDQDVTRGEFALFLYRALGAEFEAGSTAPFTDVPTTSPYFEAVSWMKTAGLTKGKADGTFGVKDEILRKDAVVLLQRHDTQQ